MKQQILDAALHLMRLNGQTTTLEVKNYLHSENSSDPNFELYQKDVSKAMKELCREKNWDRNPSSQGYIIYSDPTVPQQAQVLTLGYPATPNTQTVPTVINTSINTSNGQIVGYVRNSPKLFVTGSTRAEARTKAFQTFKTYAGKYRNINTCSSNFYFNKKVK